MTHLCRSSLALVALCAVIAGSGGIVAATPAGAASTSPDRPRVIRPLALPQGADARIDHLRDGVIHTATGRRIRVRLPHNRGQQVLLGRSGNAWVVASRKATTVRIHRVRRGHAPVKVPRTTRNYPGDMWMGWTLARDGAWLVETTYDRAGSTAEVRDARTGRLLGWLASGDYFLPLDVADGRVITHADKADYSGVEIVDWAPGTDPRRLVPDASAAFVEDDLLFRGRGGTYGPTSLSQPARPAWRHPFRPLDVSPEGTLALGLRMHPSFDDPAILELRRMDDGTLLHAFAFGPAITQRNYSLTRMHEQTARFEDDRRFVFELASARGRVLVRCNLAGRCRRASKPGGAVSTPHEQFLW